MKKSIALLICLFIFQAGYSQQQYSVKKLFKEFAKAEQTEAVILEESDIPFASIWQNTMQINAMEIYHLDDCSESIKEKLSNAARNLKDEEYETIISSNEDGERLKLLVKIKDDLIREAIFIITRGSYTLVRIKGRIDPSEIDKLTKQYGEG